MSDADDVDRRMEEFQRGQMSGTSGSIQVENNVVVHDSYTRGIKVSSGTKLPTGFLYTLVSFVICTFVIFLIFTAITSGHEGMLILTIPVSVILGGLFTPFPAGLFIGSHNSTAMQQEMWKGRLYLEKLSNKPFLYADYKSFYNGDGRGGGSSLIVPFALAYNGENIFIVDRGFLKILNWNDVLSWRWEIPGYSIREVYVSHGHVDPITRNDINQANAHSAANAAMQSGFFIRIKDIEKPTWQFTCTDRAILEKWDEIFRRLKEGETVTTAARSEGVKT